MIAILGVAYQELTRDIFRETRTFVNNKSYTFDNQVDKVYFDDKENEREILKRKVEYS